MAGRKKHDFVKTVPGKLQNLCVFSETSPVSLYRSHCIMITNWKSNAGNKSDLNSYMTPISPLVSELWDVYGEYFGKKIIITTDNPVTVKTFGLLPDQAWIWRDFPDFKHDYISVVYRSNVCFAGRGPRTSDFHGDCWYHIWYDNDKHIG